jgi:hypothetical protein
VQTFLIILLGLIPYVCLALPQTPPYLRIPMTLFVVAQGLYAAACALRERWRISKTTGQFFGYYLRLVALSMVIILGTLLFIFAMIKLFLK